MPSFMNAVKKRLPGGYMLYARNPYTWDKHYGKGIVFKCIFYHFSVYCLGGQRIKKKSIAELKPPYPVLYHFSPKENEKSIYEKGIVPNKGVVWMTDWQDARWEKKMSRYKKNNSLVCFQINTEQLIASGHQVNIINVFHEFTTDYVPSECLRPIESDV